MMTAVELNKAAEIANQVKTFLSPGCERIEIAGSIRRQKTEVKDIEIVAIPRLNPDLFGDGDRYRHKSFIDRLAKMKDYHTAGWPYTAKHLKYTLKSGIKLDLFLCTPENWGWIYLLRTGSAEFNIKMLSVLKLRGYTSQNGTIHQAALKNKVIHTPEEADVFRLAEIKFIEPQNRIG